MNVHATNRLDELGQLCLKDSRLLPPILLNQDKDQYWETRYQLLPICPEYVIEGTTGSANERSWELRKKCLPDHPRAVLESLAGLDCAAARSLREQFLHAQARGVAKSLIGVTSEHSWHLRRQLIAKDVRGVLTSLIGLETKESWEIRDNVGHQNIESLLLSLINLDSNRAWVIRERYARNDPYCALVGTIGVYGRRVTQLIRSVDGLVGTTSGLVLRLCGDDSPAAWRLRNSLKNAEPKTLRCMLWSLAGLYNSSADSYRLRFVNVSPIGVALSFNHYLFEGARLTQNCSYS